MVDDQDEVDEFEFEFEDEFEDYVSLKDRVRRGPLLGVLLWTTLVAGAIWVVLNAIVDITSRGTSPTSSRRRQGMSCGYGFRL
jgi:hypothetical protein